MKTLHLYLTRQVAASLAMTVIVFGFVLLLGNVLREVMALIIAGQASVGTILYAIVLLVPFVLVYALPMGMLTATLLVFGRFSADQELTAVRTSGISLIALITPVLLLSVAMSCVAAWINLSIAPRCRVAYKELVVRAGVERATTFIVENQYMDEFPGYVVYVGSKNDTNLQEILMYRLDANEKIQARLHAARAVLVSKPDDQQIILRLTDVRYDDFRTWESGHADEKELILDYRPPEERKHRVRLGEMSFQDLLGRLRELRALAARSAADPRAADSGAPDVVRQVEADLILPVRVYLHRQIVFSLASIAFTLIGIPLGIRAHRRETTAGIAIALILVVIYYSFIILAQAVQTQPAWAPQVILWIPNFLFQGVGIWLLWRANRGI